MSSSNLGNVLDYLRRTLSPLPTDASDYCLLARFLATRDEAAFAVLLKRHGPMVFGVCRRSLSRVQDAEDVVQATFLLLARKAGTIRRRASVGCWLHGVAQRLSLQLKRREMARLKRERRASALRPEVERPDVGAYEIQELLDAALQELPEKFRAALVLCYLEGQTHEEAAGQLGCPLGTVRSRIARGRKLLQTQVTRRGLTLSASGLAALMMAQTVSARLPAKLLAATIHAAAQYASGTPLRGLVPASVAWLVKSGLQSVALTKLVWISVGVVALGLLAGGAGLAGRQTQAGGAEGSQVEQEAKGQPKARAKATEGEDDNPRTDELGDPLPAGAITRLGTVRFNHGPDLLRLSFTPDGKRIISEGSQLRRLWDAVTGAELKSGPELHQIADPTKAVARAASASDDELITVQGSRQALLKHQYSPVKLPNGTVLNLHGRDVIHIRNLKTGMEEHTFTAEAHRWHFAIHLSFDGKLLFASNGNDTERDMYEVTVWDVENEQRIHKLRGAQGRAVAVSSDGSRLIESDYEGRITLWDLKTARRVSDNDAPYAITETVFLPPGSDRVLTFGYASISTWNGITGQRSGSFEIPRYPYGDPRGTHLFAPDGKHALSFGEDQGRAVLYLWDIASGRRLHTLQPP